MVYTTLAQTGATERFAMTYLSRCVRSHADVATILVFDCSSRRRPLQKQLYAIAKLEQAGLVSGRDVAEATEGLDFAEYAEEEDDPRNHEVRGNSHAFVALMFSCIVWVPLCTFPRSRK